MNSFRILSIVISPRALSPLSSFLSDSPRRKYLLRLTYNVSYLVVLVGRTIGIISVGSISMSDSSPKMINVYYNVVGCVLYTFIILPILFTRDKSFRTPFWIFFVSGGVYGILCILGYDFKWYWDLPTSVIQRALSSITAIAHTIAKYYVCIKRYFAIRHYNLSDNWNRSTVVLMLIAQLVIPILVVIPFAFAQPNANGIGWGPPYLMTIVQSLSAVIYGSYVIVGSILTAMSAKHLRSLMHSASEKNKTMAVRQEMLILFYSIVLFISHSLKCIQQIFFAVLPNFPELQATSLILYPYINELAVFTSPIMMLLISSKLRRLLWSTYIRPFCWRKNTVTVNTFSKTQDTIRF